MCVSVEFHYMFDYHLIILYYIMCFNEILNENNLNVLQITLI